MALIYRWLKEALWRPEIVPVLCQRGGDWLCSCDDENVTHYINPWETSIINTQFLQRGARMYGKYGDHRAREMYARNL